MNSIISVQNSVALNWNPFLRAKSLPLKPISYALSFSRKKINPNRSSCYVRLGSFGKSSLTNHKNNRRFVAYSTDGGDLSSSGASPGNWKGWVIGIVISFILRLFTHESGPFEICKKKFDESLQRVEDIMREVEKIAAWVQEQAEKWLDRLPEGWFKNALTYIKQAAALIVNVLAKIVKAIDIFQELEKRFWKRDKSSDEKSKDSGEDKK